MSLLEHYISIVTNWKNVFCKTSSFITCLLHSFCGLVILHRKTITAQISLLGSQNQDCSFHYKLYSRSPWFHQELFQPIIAKAASLFPEDYIQITADYTSIKKTGKKIPNAVLMRDPMSPKFRHNLMLGLSFLHMTITLPLYQKLNLPARSLPIRWHLMPRMKKPLKNAPQNEWEQYHNFQKENNRSKIFVEQLCEVRKAVDRAGQTNKKLLVALDGDFCNRHIFMADLKRTEIIARARKSIKLCFKHEEEGRRFYAKEKFTPEKVRQDDTILWQACKIYHGGEYRNVDFKEVKGVYWQGGAKRKELRLIVIRPIPYRRTKKGRLLYRQAAYILCTDLDMDVIKIIQAYFDRWEIEVNHKDQKHFLGVGQAQVRNEKSVERHPAQLVATYSALILAGVLAMEKNNPQNYMEHTFWYKKKRRPSIRDLSRLLIKELQDSSCNELQEILDRVQNIAAA